MIHLTTIAVLLACCLCALELGATPAQSLFEMAAAVGTGGATAPPTFQTGSQTNSAPEASLADQYWMDLTLDPGQGRMDGKMRLRCRNNSTKPLPTLRLRLDPNLDTKQALEIAAVNTPDGDSFNTFEEWVADTDPTNALSCFRIESVVFGSPVTVSFLSSSNRSYSPLSCSSLNGGVWTNVAGQADVRGSGEMMALRDTNALPRRFYRVEVRLP
jgi:hypothetical protein